MRRTANSMLGIVMSVVLAVGLMPLPAFAQGAADELGGALQADPGAALTAQGDSEPGLSVQSGDPIASGTWGTCPWEISADGTLTVHPGEGTNGGKEWNEYSDDIKRVVFASEGGNKVIAPAGSAGLLCGLKNVTSVDLKGLDTSNVTTMDAMFGECESLTSLDVSCLDTSSATSMYDMFYGCTSLKSIDLTGWDTSSLKNMGYMFCGCASLESVTLAGLDLSNVTSMEETFGFCASLASIDLSGLDTSSVKKTCYMFYGCTSLAEINLSGFSTASVGTMCCMFRDCSSLTSLDLSGFDTSSMVGALYAAGSNMNGMFEGCSSLESVKLSGWDTSKVTGMTSMFKGCSSLASLDLSGWDTSSLTGFNAMFDGCTSLSAVKLGAKVTNLGTLPSYEVDGHTDWHSKSDGRWYSSEEIAASRLGVADTYTKAEPAAITSQPKDATVALGKAAKFSVEATGEGLAYKWYFSKDGKTWKAAGSEGAALSFKATAKLDGYRFKCSVADKYGNKAVSEAATLTVSPKITTQPKDVSVAPGKATKFSVEATGEGVSYKWYLSADGGKSWKATSAKTAALAFKATAKHDGYQFKCAVADKYGNRVVSEAATLTVSPRITSQPRDVTRKAGETAKFAVKAAGEGLSYKWYLSADGGKTWKATTVGTATLSFKAKAKLDGYQFKCVVTDECGNRAISNAATLTIG